MNRPVTAVMDQAKIGGFIAELRREKNLTQAQLGEILGVNNKTVSRWECGNYMPDLAVIPQLAAELDITVSELFAGQRFAEENYKRDADKQLLQTLQLVEEVRQARECRQLTRWIFDLGAAVLIACIGYYMLNPDMERVLGLLVYALGLAAVGAVGLFWQRPAWLRRNAGSLLGGGCLAALICVCWYFLAHSYFTLPLFLLGCLLLWLGSLGDNVYYKTVDVLLKRTEKNKK